MRTLIHLGTNNVYITTLGRKGARAGADRVDRARAPQRDVARDVREDGVLQHPPPALFFYSVFYSDFFAVYFILYFYNVFYSVFYRVFYSVFLQCIIFFTLYFTLLICIL